MNPLAGICLLQDLRLVCSVLPDLSRAIQALFKYFVSHCKTKNQDLMAVFMTKAQQNNEQTWTICCIVYSCLDAT